MLTHVVTNEWWADLVREAFSEDGFDGLKLKVPPGKSLAQIDGLTAVPDLRFLEVQGRVVDDTAAFGLESLRELFLLTRCRRPIPRIRARNLSRLGFDDRPGKENVSDLANLGELAIWLWKGGDLEFLRSARRLAKLRIEGTRHIASISGVEGCLSLTELEVTALSVTSLEPLRGLSNIKRLWLIGEPKTPNVVLDLSELEGLRLLEELRLTFAGSVRSVRPLTGLPNLRDVRLRGTDILDQDEAPLDELAAKATVLRPGS